VAKESEFIQAAQHADEDMNISGMAMIRINDTAKNMFSKSC